MNLKPINSKPYHESAAEVWIKCKITGRAAKWNNAAELGWTYDCEGQPFNAYYSPEGMRIILDSQKGCVENKTD